MKRNKQLEQKVEYPNHTWGTAVLAGERLTCAGCGGIILPASLYTKHYDHAAKKGNQAFCMKCYPFWLEGTTTQEKIEGVELWEPVELFASVEE